MGANLATAQQRWCNKCKVFHDPREFGQDASRSDGFDRRCLKSRRVQSRKNRKGLPSTFKGQRHTDEAKRLIGLAHIGNKQRLGKKHSDAARQKISQMLRQRAARGKDCASFKDGKLAERRGERFSARYKQWRYDVFVRDKFTCQKCGDNRGGNLCAHHIKPFADFPELRFELNNGLTLCTSCHEQEHQKDSCRG